MSRVSPKNRLAPRVRVAQQRQRLAPGDAEDLVTVVGTVPPATADDEQFVQVLLSQVSDLPPPCVRRHSREKWRSAAVEELGSSLIIRLVGQVWRVNEPTVSGGGGRDVVPFGAKERHVNVLDGRIAPILPAQLLVLLHGSTPALAPANGGGARAPRALNGRQKAHDEQARVDPFHHRNLVGSLSQRARQGARRDDCPS